MQLTFLGNRYESTTATPITGASASVTGKYRGVEFTANTTTVSKVARRQLTYRGIAY